MKMQEHSKRDEEINRADAGTRIQSKTSTWDKLNLSQYTYSPIAVEEITQNNSRSSQSLSSSLDKPMVSTRQKKTTLPRPSKYKSSSQTLSPTLLSKRRKSTTANNDNITKHAPPSKYAHLPELRDVLALNLICIFVGLNPSLKSAVTGHSYAHPSNLFWKLLHTSGCTPRKCYPSEDGELPRLFALGNTNIVSRPTRNGSELKNSELDAGVRILEEKISKYRPEAVCIVGKRIWESIWRTRHGKNISKSIFHYGWQDETERMGIVDHEFKNWKGARAFVACSTSGLAASLKPMEKEEIWSELGAWIKERRSHHADKLLREGEKVDVMCH